jgi:diguanylate cyclase (GGDEF)-like protein
MENTSAMVVFVVLAFVGMAYYMRDLHKSLQQKDKKIDVLEKEIERQKKYATRDHLTKLGNRRAFQSDLRKFESLFGIDGDRRSGFTLSSLGVILLDIDDFKLINDTFGHDTGDMILKRVAKLVAHFFPRASDTAYAYRWGGEEMVVTLLDVADDKLASLAEALCKKIESADFGLCWANGRRPVRVTISVGITFTETHFDQKVLIKQADEAMYAAKHAGKNRVVHYRDIPELTA